MSPRGHRPPSPPSLPAHPWLTAEPGGTCAGPPGLWPQLLAWAGLGGEQLRTFPSVYETSATPSRAYPCHVETDFLLLTGPRA